MATLCHPLPRALGEEMLQASVRAICDRPGDSPEQRDSRTRQMVHNTLGFEPRDGLEFMLATVAVGHFHLILDSMRDVFQGQEDPMEAKTKTTIVAMDRAMLEMVRELRVARRRPLARPVEEPARDTAAAAAPYPAPATPDVAVPPPAPVPREIPAEASGQPAMPAPSAPMETAAAGSIASSPALADPLSSSIGETPGETEARSADPAAARVVPMPPPDWRVGMPLDWWPEITSPDGQSSALGTDLASFEDDDGGTREEHIAIFEAALAAVRADHAEARARDEATADATSGD
jgi:hypothetical protein